MEVNPSEINWLIVLSHFAKLETVWNSHPFHERLPEQIFVRLDLFFKTLRRALDSNKPRNVRFRRSFCAQMDGISFLFTIAEEETGIPLTRMFI
jgi:hypothetical protein